MAGITTQRLEQMEQAWALLDEGHSRSDVAEIMGKSLPWIAKAVAYAKKIGREIEKPKQVNPNDIGILDLHLPMMNSEIERMTKKYGGKENLQKQLIAFLYMMDAGTEDMFQKGYDAGFDEAAGIESKREAARAENARIASLSKEEAAAERAKLDAMIDKFFPDEDDEPSAEEQKEKPQAPSNCTKCGSDQIDVFEDERLWQCDACLAEESY